MWMIASAANMTCDVWDVVGRGAIQIVVGIGGYGRLPR